MSLVADPAAEIRVHGAPTPEEIAAVIAALTERHRAALVSGAGRRESGYERWRRVRLAALRSRS
jgi:hypothetical protein